MSEPFHQLPEPAALHTLMSRHHPLDWGDPLPTKAELVTAFGPRATGQALGLLRSAIGRHDQVTADLVAAIQPGDKAHQLDHRVKGPESLARKFWTASQRKRPALTDDVLRYTVLATSPDTLVDSTRQTVDRLVDRGWTVDSAHHSYLDGSRYKGVHVVMRDPTRQQVEVQFHTPESAEVKARTTRLYEVERDPRQPGQRRSEARAECIRLSAEMATPTGIEQLTELHGVAVAARCYGKQATSRAERPPAQSPTQSAEQSARQSAGQSAERSAGFSGRSPDPSADRATRRPRGDVQDGRMIT
ncbi:hypothetical protein OG394_36110 [Kribbella sp. NBC_01245]|uniref:hypothetical protein n=1 Tax=Kribbella sp. NBC_01245 TaxID=2903578 RepID=UPI002E2E289A|nr:hypothetical protein [Kribbella sp. NBC_01245]